MTSGPIWAVARYRIERVGDEDDPRGQRDRIAVEAVRIAPPVDALVAPARDLPHDRRQIDLGEDVLRQDRVLAHDLPFLFVERLRLLEDPLGDADLADIVQKRADFDRVELGSLVP